MERNTKRQMKQDCRKFMAGSIVTNFFLRLTDIAAPTFAAWMIGDMANHLLTGNRQGILAGLPGFFCAVFFQVVVVSLFRLEHNLLLTKQGFSYDSFLMERFIRLPLTVADTTDADAVMERLEEDSAGFCWNQITLLAYPAAIVLYGVIFTYVMVSSHCHVLFAVTVLVMAALPVLRAVRTGKRQTELKKETSEYNERRKQMEQELFDGRNLAVGFSLEKFFTGRLDRLFEGFLQKTGKAQPRMNGKTEILGFLCDYGAKLAAILIGAMLISLDKLTLGALLSGYLIIPTVTQCFQYVQEWVREKHDEKKYLDRLGLFYAAQEEPSEPDTPMTALEAENLYFTYPGAAAPILENVNFCLNGQENCRLTGENGCGKSTLISLLTGLYEPSSGQVCGGASLGSKRSGAAVQEQTGTIFSGTVWDNLFVPESLQERAKKLLEDMGLEKPLDYPTASEGANLSPGERKKVILARALLRNAPFLILDEPLNHLDAQGKEALLRELNNRQGGIVLISHQDMTIGGKTLPVYNMSKR